MLDDFEDFLNHSKVGLRLMLDFGDDLILENKASIEEGFIVGCELSFNTAPHVVQVLIIVVHVQYVPVLHEGCVLSQQHVLHVLEIVLGHLVVHLILVSLETTQELAFFVHGLKLFEQILFSLLSVLPGAKEGKSHVFPWGCGVEDHHFNGGNISFQLVFD